MAKSDAITAWRGGGADVRIDILSLSRDLVRESELEFQMQGLDFVSRSGKQNWEVAKSDASTVCRTHT